MVFFIQPLYRSWEAQTGSPHQRSLRWGCHARNSCGQGWLPKWRTDTARVPKGPSCSPSWSFFDDFLSAAKKNRGQSYRPCGQCMLLQHQLHNWLRLMRRKWKIILVSLFRQSQLIEYQIFKRTYLQNMLMIHTYLIQSISISLSLSENLHLRSNYRIERSPRGNGCGWRFGTQWMGVWVLDPPK